MQTAVFQILITAAPLLLAGMGALVSELAGTMAIFIDGIINLAAFCCFAVADSLSQTAGITGTNTAVTAAAVTIAALVSVLLIYGVALFTRKTQANPFLTALAVNAFSAGAISVLSALLYGSRGVLTSEVFRYPTAFSRTGTAAFAWAAALIAIFLLKNTRAGLYIRICGSDPQTLEARGIQAERYKTASWCIAAGAAALAGCMLAFRLSAFVPNISAGKGWTALAAVFLGKKKAAGTAAAILVFSAAEYAANNTQSKNVSPALLLALPYITALLLILVIPSKNRIIWKR